MLAQAHRLGSRLSGVTSLSTQAQRMLNKRSDANAEKRPAESTPLCESKPRRLHKKLFGIDALRWVGSMSILMYHSSVCTNLLKDIGPGALLLAGSIRGPFSL